MKQVDLHVHSTFSDGTFTPTELVNTANKIGLSAMALTDHDTVAGIDEAITACKDNSLEIIPGIEMSCQYNDFKEIHIVGLYVDHTDKTFTDRLEALQNTRNTRNLIIIEKFKKLGIDISYEEMLTLYKGSVLTRAHFANYLERKGYIKSKKEAFDRYIGDNGPCYVKREKITPKEGIDLIKKAGGVPILAHPTLYHLGDDVMQKMLKELKDAGLAGIECVYSTYSLGEENYIKTLAKKFDLLPSGGSDFHGANKPDIALGTGKSHLFVPYDFLDGIKKQISN